MSEVLDDERKEAFLQALHGLKEETEAQGRREQELQKAQQAALAKKLEEERKAREEAEKREAEEEQQRRRREEEKRPATPKPSRNSADHRRTGSISHPHTRSSPKKSLSKPPSRSFNTLVYSLLDNVQQLLLGTAQSIRTNPMALIRVLLFMLVFLMTVGREDVRVRLRQMIARAWSKIKGTIGMGVKVSYI